MRVPKASIMTIDAFRVSTSAVSNNDSTWPRFGSSRSPPTTLMLLRT